MRGCLGWGALFIWMSAVAAFADTRVALVIGNGDYQHTPALANPVNDAEDIAAALQRVGFSVMFERNLDKRGMDGAIARFARLAQNADAALFYFAGHGMQYRGLNYLAPVDARLEDEFSLTFELSRVDDVLHVLERARGVKILILDACRNNPLADKMRWTTAARDLAAARGLARIEPTRGMITAYATQANQVAVDGTGRNSPFTTALIREIEQPGVEIGTLFRRVGAEVHRQTQGRQLPEVALSLFGEFYLNTGETDLQAWSRIRASNEASPFRDFIRAHPRSALLPDARERLAAIERDEQARLEREHAERVRAARERLAQAQAERERLASEQREKLARDQAERERGVRERAEQERRAREGAEQAERERAERARLAAAAAERKPAEPAGTPPSRDTQTALLTPPPAPAPVQSPAAPVLSGRALVLEIKKELKRVGCLAGRPDDNWTSGETASGLKKFVRHASLSAPPDQPTTEFLDALRGKSGRVCPLECSAREVAKDGRCVTKICRAGFILDADGDCAKPRPKTASRPPPREGIAKRDAPSAATGRPEARPSSGTQQIRCGRGGCKSGVIVSQPTGGNCFPNRGGRTWFCM